MFTDKELLYKAYPLGYLAMRGVSTIGGWLCLGEHGSPGLAWAAPYEKYLAPTYWHQDGEELFGHNVPDCIPAWERGDFLPNLDPIKDPATWACAKKNLALNSKINWDEEGDLVWSRNTFPNAPPSEKFGWRLYSSKHEGYLKLLYHFFISDEDPVIALLKAQASFN